VVDESNDYREDSSQHVQDEVLLQVRLGAVLHQHALLHFGDVLLADKVEQDVEHERRGEQDQGRLRVQVEFEEEDQILRSDNQRHLV